MLPNAYRVTGANTTPLVTLAELKDHLFVYHTDYDAYLTRLLLAGQQAAENFIGEYIGGTDIQASWSDFSDLTLPHRQVADINSVTYLDIDNALVVVPASDYVFDQTGYNPVVRATRASGGWPSSTLSVDYANPITVDYEAEVNEELQTEAVVQAILLYCSGLFNDRENYTKNMVVNRLPLASERLLAPMRRISV